MPYVDGFVIPVSKDKVDTYKQVALQARDLWKEHGAIDYKECMLEDASVMEEVLSFPALAGASADETVFFSYIVYRSRAHRDEVNAKVMADARMKAMMEADPGFDCKRMAYGGFEVVVDFD